MKVPGLGRKKAERYADALLPIVARTQPGDPTPEGAGTTENEP